MDERNFAKPIAGQRIGPLEISHALRTEGREGETRNDLQDRGQVDRITVDRLRRARPDEVPQGLRARGPWATSRRNTEPVDQIASTWMHRSAGAEGTPPSPWPRLGLPGRGRSTGAGARTGSPGQEPAPPVADTAPAPAGDTDTTLWDPVPPRWHRDPHRGTTAPLRWSPRTAPAECRHHLGGARTRTGDPSPATGPAGDREDPRRGPLELILRGALTLVGPHPFGASTAAARPAHSTPPVPLTS